jgi:hypothetical protein
MNAKPASWLAFPDTTGRTMDVMARGLPHRPELRQTVRRTTKDRACPSLLAPEPVRAPAVLWIWYVGVLVG